MLPFSIKEEEQGFKYLGFHPKPNNYKQEDWYWILRKIEKRIIHWTNRFISLGGRYILVKTVLESIPVYWLALPWIQK